MNSKNWYFLGFGSLVAWIFFLSQTFCSVGNSTISGFDLLLNLILRGGSYISAEEYVLQNLVQALVLSVVLLSLTISSFRKDKKLDDQSKDGL